MLSETDYDPVIPGLLNNNQVSYTADNYKIAGECTGHCKGIPLNRISLFQKTYQEHGSGDVTDYIAHKRRNARQDIQVP